MFTGYFRIIDSIITGTGITSPGTGASPPRPITLASVSSPHFKNITMHRSVVHGGLVKRERLDKFLVKPGRTRELCPVVAT
ncbi:MAG: hypothetical protein ACC635_02960 [Acidiferrobacterales bacterium]